MPFQAKATGRRAGSCTTTSATSSEGATHAGVPDSPRAARGYRQQDREGYSCPSRDRLESLQHEQPRLTADHADAIPARLRRSPERHTLGATLRDKTLQLHIGQLQAPRRSQADDARHAPSGFPAPDPTRGSEPSQQPDHPSPPISKAASPPSSRSPPPPPTSQRQQHAFPAAVAGGPVSACRARATSSRALCPTARGQARVPVLVG